MLSLSFPGNVLKAVVHFLYSDEVRAIKGVFVVCAQYAIHDTSFCSSFQTLEMWNLYLQF